MPAKPKRDLRIIVNAETRSYDSDYVSFTGRICYIQQEQEYASSHAVGSVLNPQRAWGDYDIAHLADLAITAQRDARDEDSKWYGFELSYREPHRVTLRDMETMVKGLRVIDRRMQKLAQQYGSPADLATFCVHVASAIGCTDSRPFGQYHREMQCNGTNYRWADADTLRHYWLPKM